MAEYQYGGKGTQTFQKLHGFKKIVAWQAAGDLGFLVNQLVKHFGPGYYKLADQMRSAAISVCGNIAEGYCSGSIGNYIRHCNIARGSLGELTALIKQYSDASFFLDRLLPALVKKEQDGTWDKSYWVKEEQAEYLIDIEYDTEFPEFPEVP